MTRDAARGETRALGIFERGCIGCGSHWLGERLGARGCLGGQGEAVPCVPLGLRGVCAEVQVHRLCALLLLTALQRNVTTSTRMRGTPSSSSKDKEALGDPISPRRWRIGGLLGGTLCGRLIVGQQVQHAALVLMAASNAMRRAAWRSHCVRSSTTRYDLEELPLSKETY